MKIQKITLRKTKKKNTLLYLDENLVKAAKRFGVNMSEITEEALREKLYPHMSGGERQMFFDQHLVNLWVEERCWELPIELDSVELKNVGPIDEFKARFTSGINVVVGPNGSGKTMMFRAITHVFGQPTESKWERIVLLKHGKKSGEIKIKLRGGPMIKLELEKEKEKASHPRECLLVDEPLDHAMTEHKRKFVEWLGRGGGQVIIFTRDESFAVPSAHVIHLQKSSTASGSP